MSEPTTPRSFVAVFVYASASAWAIFAGGSLLLAQCREGSPGWFIIGYGTPLAALMAYIVFGRWYFSSFPSENRAMKWPCLLLAVMVMVCLFGFYPEAITVTLKEWDEYYYRHYQLHRPGDNVFLIIDAKRGDFESLLEQINRYSGQDRDWAIGMASRNAYEAGQRETAWTVIKQTRYANFDRLLVWGAEFADRELFEYALAHGAKVNPPANAKFYPLLAAAGNRQSKELVLRLLELGALVRVRSPFGGTTPLLAAAGAQDVEVLKTLLAAGANLRDTDADGKNVLMYAAERGNADSFEYILKQMRWDLQAKDKYGYTIVSLVADQLNHNRARRCVAIRELLLDFDRSDFNRMQVHLDREQEARLIERGNYDELIALYRATPYIVLRPDAEMAGTRARLEEQVATIQRHTDGCQRIIAMVNDRADD